MDHIERYRQYQQMIDDSFTVYIPDIPIIQSCLLDSMLYSLLSGGKRIRGILLLEFYRLCGGDPVKALPFASAIEMIHAYSLIHDDLPCMDNDDMRRGRPSNHIIFGESTALLAGSALLSAAFETMLDSSNLNGIPPERILRAAHAVAWASGLYGMAGGQQLDMQCGFDGGGLEQTANMQSLKTGALISVCAEAGCVLAGAGKHIVNHAKSYAEALGLAFQIKDDLLNIEGDPEKLGKSVGSDDENNKMTFVRILGAEESRKLVKSITSDAIGYLEPFSDKEFLIWLADELAVRDK